MSLIKKIVSFNFALLFASSAFAVSGYLLISNHQAKAASQSYTEQYTVSKWRNCDRWPTYNDDRWPTYNDQTKGLGSSDREYQSIGPAEWNVTGKIGDTTFSEVWVGGDWKEINSRPPYSTSCSNGAYATGSAHWDTGFYTTGMYGMTSFAYGIFSSMPGKWDITGTITTP